MQKLEVGSTRLLSNKNKRLTSLSSSERKAAIIFHLAQDTFACFLSQYLIYILNIVL